MIPAFSDLSWPNVIEKEVEMRVFTNWERLRDFDPRNLYLVQVVIIVAIAVVRVEVAIITIGTLTIAIVFSVIAIVKVIAAIAANILFCLKLSCFFGCFLEESLES
jgi:hypothetical protein